MAGFGTNEWLVEEMYQQFLADPGSVDQAWHDFFADYRPGSPVADAQDRSDTAAEPAAPAATSPAPAAEVAAPPPAASRAPAAEASATRPSSPPATPGSPAPAAVATDPTERTKDTVVAKPAEPAAQAQAQAQPAGTTAAAPAGGKHAASETTGPTRTQLRGAAASVVKNMNASLTVPTATSVRAVPAKLLADNRVVINNHLARSRGGKVSFTHLIGYALIRALDDFPEMNASFAEVDGKPHVVQPEHVNFGLAIDLPKS
ncbi:MAG TPA: 2-oxo acid dehydrogenase subunit E2, partial [Modestobacter sp.]|nr:2-oxo acid dehydrogenase subunit E2 [Modestobacter sp.]